MKSFRLLNHQARRVTAAVALLFATVTPALVPALVSAATVTNRSIELSSSVKSVTSNYKVKFTGAAVSTGAFVVEFCTNAAIGTACTPPSGIDTTNVDVASGGHTVTPINTNKAVKVELASSVANGTEVSVELTGITNPSVIGTFYARIVTYQDGSTNYHYTAADNLGTYLDSGAVALSITDGFGVSGAVLETLTFCAAKSTDTIGTGCTGALSSPSISLGADGVLGTTPSEGTVKTQISTNAVGGAVVNLKSGATGCGGLVRQGAATNAEGCGIAPITTANSVTTLSSTTAQFGLKLGSLGGATGTTAALANSYDTSHYYMHWVNGDATGVTSPYGDPVYNTNNAPVSDGTADLTFAAVSSNVTPAGNYSATLNLIATGTF